MPLREIPTNGPRCEKKRRLWGASSSSGGCSGKKPVPAGPRVSHATQVCRPRLFNPWRRKKLRAGQSAVVIGKAAGFAWFRYVHSAVDSPNSIFLPLRWTSFSSKAKLDASEMGRPFSRSRFSFLFTGILQSDGNSIIFLASLRIVHADFRIGRLGRAASRLA
jgi:hypothetical protein